MKASVGAGIAQNRGNFLAAYVNLKPLEGYRHTQMLAVAWAKQYRGCAMTPALS